MARLRNCKTVDFRECGDLDKFLGNGPASLSLRVHSQASRDELLEREIFDSSLEAKVLIERWW
jgi:hypothetical protein